MALKKFFTRAYDRVYFTAELRTQEDYAKSKDAGLTDRERLTYKETKQRIIQFFGLPSGDAKKPIEILKGLAGWNEKYSTSRNVLQALIIFPVNLLLTASKLALNIAKLGTEFLPYILAKGSLGLFNACGEFFFGDSEDSLLSLEKFAKQSMAFGVAGALLKLVGLLSVVLLGIMTAAFHIAYFIGGATTSPAENFRAAFRAGNELVGGNNIVEDADSNMGNSKIGKVVGTLFALVSALTTACVYAILFPVLLAQAPAILPAIANGISQFVGIFSAQAGASAAAFFTTTLPAALASFGATISSLVEPLLIGLATSAAIGAGVIAPVVVAIDEVGETIKDEPPGDDDYAKLMGITPKEIDLDSLLSKGKYTPYYPPVLPNLPNLPDLNIGEKFRSLIPSSSMSNIKD